MIFILTFNLVAVSGFRGEEIIKLACERLSTIFMGIIISVFTSLLIFPIWAGDELHLSLVSKFDKLALTIEGVFQQFGLSFNHGSYFKLHSFWIDYHFKNEEITC